MLKYFFLPGGRVLPVYSIRSEAGNNTSVHGCSFRGKWSQNSVKPTSVVRYGSIFFSVYNRQVKCLSVRDKKWFPTTIYWFSMEENPLMPLR